MNSQNLLVASKTGVVVGIPTLGRPVSLKWASSYKSLHPPINFNMTICQINGAPVADARNAIAREALKLESRYVFFLGDDVVVPSHAMRQFIMRMENNPDIGVIGGVYCSKSTPPAPLVFRGNGQGSYWDWKAGEFFEVTGLGMDCTLIRTDLFRQLPEPWFKTIRADDFADGVNKADEWTEDLYFLKRVSEETESRIFCDASIICEHEDVFSGKSWTLPSGTLPLRRATVEPGQKKVVDIGCGPIHREIEGVKALRVDIRADCNPDYRCDVRELPFASNSFDIVFSSHVLEHFNRAEWKIVLKEWTRIVSKEGKIVLVLPNIAWAAWMIHEQKTINDDVLNVLYGAQSYKYDFHYNGLTPERVNEALAEIDFVVTSVETEGYNMVIEARRKEKSDGNTKQNDSDSTNIASIDSIRSGNNE
jgi:SAM-dependent methyltransferase